MSPVIVALGSNVSFAGRASAPCVAAAANAVGRLGHDARLSSLWRSNSWPDPAGPAYVNAAVALKTALSPEALLAALLAIEAGFGRRRSDDPAERYRPRTMDLDLIDHGGRICGRATEDGLVLPHPRVSDRAFVLAPLSELRAEWRHPVSGQGVATLLAAATDRVDRLPFTGRPGPRTLAGV